MTLRPWNAGQRQAARACPPSPASLTDSTSFPAASRMTIPGPRGLSLNATLALVFTKHSTTNAGLHRHIVSHNYWACLQFVHLHAADDAHLRLSLSPIIWLQPFSAVSALAQNKLATNIATRILLSGCKRRVTGNSLRSNLHRNPIAIHLVTRPPSTCVPDTKHKATNCLHPRMSRNQRHCHRGRYAKKQKLDFRGNHEPQMETGTKSCTGSCLGAMSEPGQLIARHSRRQPTFLFAPPSASRYKRLHIPLPPAEARQLLTKQQKQVSRVLLHWSKLDSFMTN